MSEKRISFFTAEGEAIETEAIRVVLPDGESFLLEALPGRKGAAVLTIDAGTPENPSYRAFSLEPGAANLVSVRVLDGR